MNYLVCGGKQTGKANLLEDYPSKRLGFTRKALDGFLDPSRFKCQRTHILILPSLLILYRTVW